VLSQSQQSWVLNWGQPCTHERDVAEAHLCKERGRVHTANIFSSLFLILTFSDILDFRSTDIGRSVSEDSGVQWSVLGSGCHVRVGSARDILVLGHDEWSGVSRNMKIRKGMMRMAWVGGGGNLPACGGWNAS